MHLCTWNLKPRRGPSLSIMAKRVPLLEGQLEAAMKLAHDNLDKAVEARKELVQKGKLATKV